MSFWDGERQDAVYGAGLQHVTDDVRARYEKLCMDLGGFYICDGTVVAVVDARGRTIRGVFRRISGNFIVLSSDCSTPPSHVIRHQHISHIVILGFCHGAGPGNGSPGIVKPEMRYTENTESHTNQPGGAV